MKSKLLLHTCCGPCSIYVVEQLSKDYEVTVYFFNPNIHPRKEYLARRDEIKKYLDKIKVEFVEGEYNTKDWFNRIKGLEKEPEKGKRCDICFELRLGKTAEKAKQDNYDYWAATLSISPHKDIKKINSIANKLAKQYKVPFLDKDWKKNNGFKIACDMSKQENFYRQNYCGCIYSQKNET